MSFKFESGVGFKTIGMLGMFVCFSGLFIRVMDANTDDSITPHQRTNFAGVLGKYNGDFMLGGLFPIHNYDQQTKSCQHIQSQDGIQPMEALYFTLDEINNSGFFPGFTLGALVADTCNTIIVALERSVEFVRDLTDSLTFPGQLPLRCRDGSAPVRVGTSNLNRVLGVIGPTASSVTTQVASFLQLFKVPQISYLSTSPDLSNKERYSYFLRTVPADNFQAMAIVQILRHFKWTYVSAVYDDTNYGTEGFGQVEKLAANYGICFAVVKKIRSYPSSSEDFSEEAMDQVVNDLVQKKSAKVVVVFTDFTQARRLFVSASKNPASRGLIWIGSDGWSGRESVVQGLQSVVENAITVQPLARKLPNFDRYFTSLKPSPNTRNPWFREFWASHFKCHWPDSPQPWMFANPEPCDELQRPSEENGYLQLLALTYVRNTAYVYAHALRNMHADRCGNVTGICPAMSVSNITGTDLLEYLRNVSFTEMNGLEFRFLNGVDGPPRYSILKYRRGLRGKYRWVEIGNYTHQKNEDRLILSDPFGSGYAYPASFCSSDCARYQIKKTLETDKCCWVCVNCTAFQYLPNPGSCQDCPSGFLPNSGFDACVSIPEVFVRHGQALSIGLSIFALTGIVFCIIIGIVFFKFRQTPVIKASGKELSLVLLAGVALSYSSTLAFVSEPTKVSCGFTRFLFGFCYTVCYAAILTKTNRIARIFHGGKKGATKTKYTTPKSQLVILAILTGVEVVVLVTWAILRPPDVSHLYPTRLDNIRICKESEKASYLIGLIYPFVLVVLCTIYAVKTRKTPDGFNETKFIAFCSYSTCILWLSFVPIYFANSDYTLRVITLSASLSANSTVILICLFIPKIYIVIWRPNKNTREAVMARTATFHSHGEHPSSKGSNNDNGEQTKEKEANREVISMISSPDMDMKTTRTDPELPDKMADDPYLDSEQPDKDIQNQSTDSGCYVNAGFRDSRTFLDEGINVENVDAATLNSDSGVNVGTVDVQFCDTTASDKTLS